MKRYFLLIYLLLSIVAVSDAQQQSLKDALKACMEKYCKHVNYFMAEDTRYRENLPDKFQQLFVHGAHIEHSLPKLPPQLTVQEYGLELAGFSENTKLQLEGLHYCRFAERADAFKIYAMQTFLGQYLQPQPHELPRFGVILSVIQGSDSLFRIASIEKMPVEFVHDLDSDDDGIPDRLDKCPWLAGGLETDGAHPVKPCPQDTDGDGTLDEKDKCPNQFGESEEGGCPNYNKNELEAIAKIKEAKRTGVDTLSLLDSKLTRLPSAIKELNQLKKLNLSKNQIQDLTILRNLKQLTSLNLSENQISDVSALQDLKQLTSLDLYTNKIQTLNLDLNLLPNLEYLRLSGNPIQNIPQDIAPKEMNMNEIINAIRLYQKQLRK